MNDSNDTVYQIDHQIVFFLFHATMAYHGIHGHFWILMQTCSNNPQDWKAFDNFQQSEAYGPTNGQQMLQKHPNCVSTCLKTENKSSNIRSLRETKELRSTVDPNRSTPHLYTFVRQKRNSIWRTDCTTTVLDAFQQQICMEVSILSMTHGQWK